MRHSSGDLCMFALSALFTPSTAICSFRIKIPNFDSASVPHHCGINDVRQKKCEANKIIYVGSERLSALSRSAGFFQQQQHNRKKLKFDLYASAKSILSVNLSNLLKRAFGGLARQGDDEEIVLFKMLIVFPTRHEY